MSTYGVGSAQCEAFQDQLAELALGILFGRDRSELLEHVGTCPHCTANLERLSVVADSLVQLAPEVEPPLGFELRLAGRLQNASSKHRPKRLRGAGVLSVAAAVIVLLGFGLGVLAAPEGNTHVQSATSNLTSAKLTAHGHVLGQVILSAGHPAWMFMTVTDGSWSGRVTCTVTLIGGKVETVGEFNLSGGYGDWGVPLTSPADTVRLARLIAPNGSILASATLSA
jgi:anti-sigma factor RsiW